MCVFLLIDRKQETGNRKWEVSVCLERKDGTIKNKKTTSEKQLNENKTETQETIQIEETQLKTNKK